VDEGKTCEKVPSRATVKQFAFLGTSGDRDVMLE